MVYQAKTPCAGVSGLGLHGLPSLAKKTLGPASVPKSMNKDCLRFVIWACIVIIILFIFFFWGGGGRSDILEFGPSNAMKIMHNYA